MYVPKMRFLLLDQCSMRQLLQAAVAEVEAGAVEEVVEEARKMQKGNPLTVRWK